MTTHSLVHTGVWRQTHLFICLKLVKICVPDLPARKYILIRNDGHAFAEDRRKGRKQGTGLDCMFQPNLARDTVHPSKTSSLPLCISF